MNGTTLVMRPGAGRSIAICLVLVCVGIFATSCLAADAPTTQVAVPLVERMPNLPQPFCVIDWKSRARGFDLLAFDANAKGEFLPLLRLVDRPRNIKPPGFSLPSYVGGHAGSGEGICTLAAVMGASLAGVDKSNQQGQNWVRMCQDWFNPDKAIGVVLNGPGSHGAGSFWYDLLPGVIFCQLADRYPNVEGMESLMRAMADRYREVCRSLGGADADFNFTAFDFVNNRGVLNGRWREPDAAAAIAWIEYAAWIRWGDVRHLETARWCLDFLQRRDAKEGSPLYESMMYYGPVVAARMNAEQDAGYDMVKLVNWCLGENQDANASRKAWGILAVRFGEYDVHGLQGSTHPGQGYPFAMNTFQAAAAMAPVARYDDRFARAIGKWLLNVANNARLFYGDGLPADMQSCPNWKGDPVHVIAYEGLRQEGRKPAMVTGEKTVVGRRKTDKGTESRLCRGTYVPAEGRLEQVWEFSAPTKVKQGHWNLRGRTRAATETFSVSIRKDANSAWQSAAKFPRKNEADGAFRCWGELKGIGDGQRFWLKVETLQPAPDVQLQVELVAAEFATRETPFACGDALVKYLPSDFCLYGAAHVGYLAALVERTNCEHVLRFDLLATDFFHGAAYPTFLYYNPDPQECRVKIDVGVEPRDLYETVTNTFVARNVCGQGEFVIPADTAAVIVIAPAGGKLTREGHRTKIDGVVVDWR